MTVQYAPKLQKKAERFLTFALLFLGVLCFLLSQLPSLSLPALLQLAGILLLTGGVILLMRYLLRDFVYLTESVEGAAHDFVVIEQYNKKRTTVCRISVEEIEAIEPISDPKARKTALAKCRGKLIYDYTAEMRPAECYLLTVRTEDGVCYAKIVADEALLRAISQ